MSIVDDFEKAGEGRAAVLAASTQESAPWFSDYALADGVIGQWLRIEFSGLPFPVATTRSRVNSASPKLDSTRAPPMQPVNRHSFRRFPIDQPLFVIAERSTRIGRGCLKLSS
jgi:hypothetical protein